MVYKTSLWQVKKLTKSKKNRPADFSIISMDSCSELFIISALVALPLACLFFSFGGRGFSAHCNEGNFWSLKCSNFSYFLCLFASSLLFPGPRWFVLHDSGIKRREKLRPGSLLHQLQSLIWPPLTLAARLGKSWHTGNTNTQLALQI